MGFGQVQIVAAVSHLPGVLFLSPDLFCRVGGQLRCAQLVLPDNFLLFYSRSIKETCDKMPVSSNMLIHSSSFGVLW